jgi:type II secretory pathway pseudopilin PulG
MSSTILRNSARGRSGFTLIELILYVGIIGVLLLVISTFLSLLLQSRIKNQVIGEVEQQGLHAMRLITQTVRNADTINAPATGASGASLSLNTYTAAVNPTVFDLSGGVLRIKEGADAVVPLTNARVTASSLSVQNLTRTSTPGVLRIQFTLTAVNASGRNEYSYQKTFIGSASLRQP